MFKGFILTAFRSFSKSLSHVSMNIIGLGIGIGMCLMTFLLNAYNSEFNKEYDKEITRDIYRLEYSNIENDEKEFYGSIELARTQFLDYDIPGIESVMRFFGRQATLKVNDNRFNEFISFCNEDFLKSFSFDLVSGSFVEFNEPGAIYLSEELAEKFFGEEITIGKPLELFVKDTEGGIQDYIVKGVFKPGEENSSFGYVSLLTNFDNLYRAYNIEKLSDNTGVAAVTFISVSNPENLNNPSLLTKLKEQADILSEEGNVEFRFTPFKKIHIDSDNNVRNTFSRTEIPGGILLTFNLMGILILLIACFNYTIYAFSSAGKRLKEIGVRKVTGGNRRQIIMQFMTESLILSIVALAAGIVITNILIPIFDRIFDGFPYSLSDMNPIRLASYLVGITLIMAVVSGFYPALYVSRFNPTAIMTKNTKLKKTGVVTYSLILFQQAITIIGLGASIVFTHNIYWQENMDYGYDKENLLTIQGLNAMEKSDVFIEAVEQHPKVVSTGISWKMLGNGTGDRKIIVQGTEYYVDLMETGPNYMETNKVRLKSGRFWRNDSETDMSSTAVVNEEFIKVTNIQDPISEKITLPNGHIVTVIGVIENYKQAGPFESVEPTVIHYPLEKNFKFLAIRANSLEDLKEIDAFCKEKWESIEPFTIYRSFFTTQNIEGALEANISFKKTFLLTAFIALILSVGGMFSLVSMLLQKRTKEIAIRKAIGSNIKGLLLLVSKPYIRVSLLAGIAGSILGMILVTSLLKQIYEYYVNVNLLWYMLASFIMLLVTLLTISSQTIRAALANPVKGLRYE